MMMLCGQSNQIWHYWAGKYPGRVGYLFGPKHMSRQAIRPWMPFACDNDAFIAYTKGETWNELAWFDMLERVKLTRIDPLWVLVPDVVADRAATLEAWERYSPVIDSYGWKKAFAVQDDMTPSDVPHETDVVFVGGSNSFKWRTIETWASHFPHVHVGRVNSLHRVWQCDDLGVKSVDGTAWFRDPSRKDRIPALQEWIDGHRRVETMELDFEQI